MSRCNLSILFDHMLFFRIFDHLRIFIKTILTKLNFRDRQSCKYCGRDQYVIWNCKDDDWNKLPQKWHNKALCIECFVALYPEKLNLSHIEIQGFNYITKQEKK